MELVRRICLNIKTSDPCMATTFFVLNTWMFWTNSGDAKKRNFVSSLLGFKGLSQRSKPGKALKLKSIGRGNFPYNLQRNAVARQVAVEIARTTPSSQPVSQRKIALAVGRKVTSLLLFGTLRDTLQRVICIMQLCLAMLSSSSRCDLQQNLCDNSALSPFGSII